ncbi:Octamer-binding transcription factor [Parasponia andersonii]|uniref:Octamer-binding transcription factor n=1 Tax=Parasponia andersonii TaxID=3476 RepID=A0A2P5ADS4_PARAD|nr:Octamer-binding transcription factor [Parasponia andersonii]
MAKPNFPEKQTTWGTWEELLLACAVHRYGIDSWDSVATELRKRTSIPHLLLTPHSCKHKYHDLKRRFARNDVVSAPSDEKDDGAAIAASIPFLDELRRLRVAELRREVERYDISIVSLETKVEKLKEEREQSLKGPEKPDLEKESKDDDEEEEETVRSEGASRDNMADKAVSGGGSVYDESNSTNLKGEALPGPEPATSPPIPAEPASAAAGELDRVREYGKLAVEDSYNGSSETIGKESAAVSPVQESEKVLSEKNGGGDSAESKEEEEGTKEVCSSEMQSSTSLSRKKKVEESDEPEDQSVDTKRAPIESQSLIDFLEILRSHKPGSFFERRLEIQGTPKYINTIRQHMDFGMVRNRLEEGWYSGCKSKFFRDLLLIFNNAIVFLGRKSPETKAAIELRHLLLKEMALKTTTKRDSLPKDETGALPSKKEPEEQEQPSEMLLRKSKLSVPMNACRKRSSITARASTSSSGAERKKEQTNALLDVKSAMSWKQSDKSSSDKADEFSGTKKKRKDRFRTGTRNSSNKNGTSRSSTEINKNSCSNTNVGTSSRGASNENSASKATDKEKNNSSSTASGKKRSATNFLNRMKRSSSSNNGSLLETLKDSDNSSRGGAEQKKNGAGKGSNSSSRQKEQASRRTSGSKQAKEPESPAKRSVGRPSKRTASVAAEAVVPAKRSRQSVENEALAPRNAKKRSRK